MGSLAVVKVTLRGGGAVSCLPIPRAAAQLRAEALVEDVTRAGVTAALVGFDVADGVDMWLRARDVQTVAVWPDEDPSVGSPPLPGVRGQLHLDEPRVDRVVP